MEKNQGYDQAWMVRPFFNKKTAALVILSLIFFPWIFSVAANNKKTERPNILFISLDALRADHLGCYGYPRKTSANIDALAKQGALFTQAITQYPNTTGSICSLLTSLYPSHELVEPRYSLSPENPRLTEILKKNGYQIALFSANEPSFSRTLKYIQKDFDVFDCHIDESDSLIETVNQWLRSASKKPFFLWVHLLDPHGPYKPPLSYYEGFLHDNLYPEKFVPIAPDDGKKNEHYCWKFIPRYVAESQITDTRFYVAKYDGEIKFADEQIGKLLKQLETLNLGRTTLIVLFSDHGESMTEHDFYFNHSHHLYEGLIRVPLIFVFPNKIPIGKIIFDQVQLVDILPTILDFAGLKKERRAEGVSLRPLLQGKKKKHSPFAFSESAFWPAPQCIRTERWKLIQNRKRNKSELYDLKNDPQELTDVIQRYPGIAQSLKKYLENWLRHGRTYHIQIDKNVSKEEFEKLKSLGYIQ